LTFNTQAKKGQIIIPGSTLPLGGDEDRPWKHISFPHSNILGTQTQCFDELADLSAKRSPLAASRKGRIEGQ
jgi:hypothetical protein